MSEKTHAITTVRIDEDTNDCLTELMTAGVTIFTAKNRKLPKNTVISELVKSSLFNIQKNNGTMLLGTEIALNVDYFEGVEFREFAP